MELVSFGGGGGGGEGGPLMVIIHRGSGEWNVF